MKHFDWMFQVTWPLLTNQSSLFLRIIEMLLLNLLITSAPGSNKHFIRVITLLLSIPKGCNFIQLLLCYFVVRFGHASNFVSKGYKVDWTIKLSPSVTRDMMKANRVTRFLRNFATLAKFQWYWRTFWGLI